MAKQFTDHTGKIPFILFGILAAIVAYCIIKEKRRISVQMKEDVMYIKPAQVYDNT